MMMTIKMITTMILLIMIIITRSVLVFMCQTVLLTV